MSQIPTANPDTRPLPDGWITEHSTQWNAWYYVNTKDPNPQAVWSHPSEGGTPAPEYSAFAPHGHDQGASAPAAGGTAGQPSNPDTRPLPDGWVSQYSPEHKIFFYVNERATDANSTVTWDHPANKHPPATDLKSPATATTQAHAEPHASSTVGGASAAGGAGALGATAAAATGEHRNPDTRPLPAGWKTEYDPNYKTWYYLDPTGTSNWTHPAENKGPTGTTGTSHATAPAATATTGATFPQQATSTAAPVISKEENPDKRPLPPGWITKFDPNYGVWYYVDTTKPGSISSWEHPAETKPAGTGAPAGASQPGATQGAGAPIGSPPAQTYNQQGAPGGKGGLEGLLGASAGKMVGGILGGKARTQMDTFADKLGVMKNKYAAPPPPSQGAYNAPGGQAPPPSSGPPQGVPPGQQHYQQGYAPASQQPSHGHAPQHGGGLSLNSLAGFLHKK